MRKNTSPTLSASVVDLLRAEEKEDSYRNLWKECSNHVRNLEVTESRHLQQVDRVVFNVGVDSSDEDTGSQAEDDPQEFAVVLD